MDARLNISPAVDEIRVIFYIINWVQQFNYSIYTLCLMLADLFTTTILA
jgi:hypothetical protein